MLYYLPRRVGLFFFSPGRLEFIFHLVQGAGLLRVRNLTCGSDTQVGRSLNFFLASCCLTEEPRQPSPGRRRRGSGRGGEVRVGSAQPRWLEAWRAWPRSFLVAFPSQLTEDHAGGSGSSECPGDSNTVATNGRRDF